MSTYTKSLSSDFGENIVKTRFHREIVDDGTIGPTLNNIQVNGDDVDITFASALSAGEQTTLSNLVATHNATQDNAEVVLTSTGTFNTKTTLTGTQTANRTINLPDESTTLVGTDTEQTLTHKSINASNNTITGLANTDVGLGYVNNTKVKLNGTSAPMVNDDTSEGYTIGSRWMDISNDVEYVCLDNTDGAAVWTETTSHGETDHTNLSNIGTNTHAQIDTHIATSNAHGVSESIVGTSDTQTLTNKTINTTNNTIIIATTDITSGTLADARVVASNVTQHEGSINHDNLSGFVTNKHINHSSVSITAGTGLSGGGTITSTRTINMDINSLSTDASPDRANDYVVTYDASALGHKKVLLNDMLSSGSSIFGSEFQEASSESESSTTSETYQQKLRLTTDLLPYGKYRIGWYYEWKYDNGVHDFKARIQINDSTTIMEQQEEVKDTGTNQAHTNSGFYYADSISGVQNIDLDYCSSYSGKTAYIKRSRLEIWRIS